MKRDVFCHLKKWASSKNFKPLILRGPRQVGKSWLVQKLGKFFENFVEINFEMQPELKTFFDSNIDPHELIRNISNYLKVKIIPGKTLLFFDEVQQVPKAISSLRFFYEKVPELNIIAAGSLLEFELKNISIPVGRVTFLYIYPLSFSEFLTATGNENLRGMIKDGQALPSIFHEQLLKHVRNYTLVGGMPEVIKEYINTGDLLSCMNIQSDILQTYISDFNKYATKNQIKYLSKLFNLIPFNLGKKFKFSNIDNSIKSTVLNGTLELLEMAGIIYKVSHTSANGVPLGAEVNHSRFKVLFFDVGLSLRLLNLDYSKFLLDSNIFLINNGAIAELFVGLELVNYSNKRERPSLYYWHRESKSSNAEVDYVIAKNQQIIPIEVKSSSTGSMKSLKIFMTSKESQEGLKISFHPYTIDNNVRTVPFYGIEKYL